MSQNNQQNALPNGLGGVSLQTYHYDAMNRLIRSSGDNFDAGVSYNFQQTYSPSGRIGDKFCDFTHSDHLGSSSWTTDVNGHAIQHIEYLPFGEEFVNQRTTPYEDRYTFTGKELDAESNLYYYDARYNSSTYSQFTSPDPMSDKYPSVSPYLYCAGNPIRFVDPTGMQFENYEIVDYICNYIRNIFTENFDLIEVCKNDFVNNNSSDVAESDYNFMSNLIEENNCLFDALLYIDMLSKNKTCYGFGTNNNSEKLNYVLLDNDNVNRVIGSDVGTWMHELSHLAQKEIEKNHLLMHLII